MEIIKTFESKQHMGATARCLADILFRMGDDHFAETESGIQAAIINHERLDMKWDLAHNYLVLGQLLKSTERWAEATGFLNKAW
jgi:hypothetical protein